MMYLDQDRLTALAAEHRMEAASIVVLPLDIAADPVALDPGAPLYPASMIKVPLVAAALLEVASGRLAALDATVEVTPPNMTANDAASPLVPGYRASLFELMCLAIARSDNVATNVLFDLVGRERATEVVTARLGLKSTVFARKLSGADPLIEDPGWDGRTRNAHPAGDAARLMRLVADDAFPLAGRLREMLGEQEWNDKLSRGLRAGDRFAHKTGDTSEVTHDGGILDTAEGKRYIVIVYTGMPSTDETNARFGPFMAGMRELL